MSDHQQQLPITTPPRRCNEHPALAAAALLGNHGGHGSAESCKNSPNVPRRLETHHHLLLESGSQSAANSPLPNRRLDKLQGVIRDKSSPLCGRRGVQDGELGPVGLSSMIDYQDSPIVSRKFNQGQDCACSRQQQQQLQKLNHTGCVQGVPPMNLAMRKRGDSDCTCMRKNIIRNQYSASLMKTSAIGGSGFDSGASSSENTPLLRRKDPFLPSSPAKGVLGEPGVFSSPVHHHHAASNSCGNSGSKLLVDHGGGHCVGGSIFGSPAKSVLGEPGVFNSPARSVCSPTAGAGDYEGVEVLPGGTTGDGADVLANDQTIVSGWLKFRDNKKWKIRWGVVTKLSPAAAIFTSYIRAGENFRQERCNHLGGVVLQ
ncbi:uncharacterized protein LOC129742753 [Uranotaenia lowii]|uniref:uncharacterized protein LOC129742753 n=1 Tax=Uranotaenia lowii TaxID=190385 RepID=UPI002479809F|nr:uncharacterized protein LOC129742753 [Uranotaenia lowii]